MANVSLGPSESGILSVAVVSASATGITGVAGVTGKFIRVYKLFLVTGGTTIITFQDGTTSLAGGISMGANSSIVLDMDGQPWFTTSLGNAFNINNNGTNIQVAGALYYTTQAF